jgi:hypothetical protein
MNTTWTLRKGKIILEGVEFETLCWQSQKEIKKLFYAMFHTALCHFYGRKAQKLFRIDIPVYLVS